MGKKSGKRNNASTTIIINSEESAIAYLENMIQQWVKKGRSMHTESVLGITFVPKDYRTPNVIKFILSRFSNIGAQAEGFPRESLKGDLLIQTLLLGPEIMDPILSEIIVEKHNASRSPEEIKKEDDEPYLPMTRVKNRLQHSKKKKNPISKEDLTIPALVAYEIGNRFGKRGVDIDLLELYFGYCEDGKDRSIVYQIADDVYNAIIQRKLRYAFYSYTTLRYEGKVEQKGASLQQISDIIQEKYKEALELKSNNIEKSEPYKIKYKKVKINQGNQGQKLAILIGGHSNSGKTTLSKVLKERFTQAKSFDSNDLMGDLNPLRSSIDFFAVPSMYIDSEDDVVIYSDPLVLPDSSKDAIDIMGAMGDPKVVRILIKPKDDCIEKMIERAKGNWNGRRERLITEVKDFTKNYAKNANVILENDFSKDAMAKMADKVIDYIIKEYPGLLSIVDYVERPDASDFAKAVKDERIQEGVNNAENRFGEPLLGIKAEYVPE